MQSAQEVGTASNTVLVADTGDIAAAAAKAVTFAGEDTEKYVRSYFEDVPVLAEIAKCESRFRQFSSNGTVMRGSIIPDDVGVMQINEYFHKKTADKLGLDLHTLDGNLAYAKWLYEREGVKPWSASSRCWEKTIAKI